MIDAFHIGAHPQREVPQDLDEAGKERLDAERAQLKGTSLRVPDEEPGALGAGGPLSTVPVDPANPSAGVLYAGPSAEEEQLLNGIDPKAIERMSQAREKRLGGLREELQSRQLEQAATLRSSEQGVKKVSPDAKVTPDRLDEQPRSSNKADK